MTRVRTSVPKAIQRLLSPSLLLLAIACSATATAGQAPAAPPAAAAKTPEPRVTEVIPAEGGLQRTIRVTVVGLKTPQNDQQALELGNEYLQWVLYLNGRPMVKLHPIAVDAWRGQFHFEMRRNKDSADAWRVLFKQFAFWQFTNRIELTVGPAAGGTRVVPLRSDATTAPFFDLVIVPAGGFIALAVAYAVLALIVLWLAKRTSLLRVPAASGVPLLERQFSLGRAQMAMWFMIALAAYLFLGLVTADWKGSMNASTLGLMGISALTALGAHAMDVKKDALATEEKALQAQATVLTDTIAGAQPVNATPVLAAQLQTVTTKLEGARATLADRQASAQALAQSRPTWWRFLRDLVNDENGVALHRVQVVVWTIVLGGAFVYFVVRDLEMPEFDSTLLTLMGISSGTYLGFKWPEKQ